MKLLQFKWFLGIVFNPAFLMNIFDISNCIITTAEHELRMAYTYRLDAVRKILYEYRNPDNIRCACMVGGYKAGFVSIENARGYSGILLPNGTRSLLIEGHGALPVWVVMCANLRISKATFYMAVTYDQKNIYILSTVDKIGHENEFQFYGIVNILNLYVNRETWQLIDIPIVQNLN